MSYDIYLKIEKRNGYFDIRNLSDYIVEAYHEDDKSLYIVFPNGFVFYPFEDLNGLKFRFITPPKNKVE